MGKDFKMDRDLFNVLTAVVLVIFLGVFSHSYNNKKDNEAIVELVSKGVSPLAAKCAIRPDPSCAVLFSK